MTFSFDTTMITALNTADVTMNKDEAVTNQRPYSVYSMNVRPFSTKAGVYKMSGSMTITTYADSYSTGSTINDTIITTLASSMNTSVFRCTQTNEHSECIDGVWQFVLEYNISQYNN